MRFLPALLLLLLAPPVWAEGGEQPETSEAPAPTEDLAPAEDAGDERRVAVADAPADANIGRAYRTGEEGLAFGSYGRVIVGSDMRGSSPEGVNVVRHGSRIIEPTYLELDLYYRLRAQNGVKLTTVTTLGFADDLFHDTGRFDSRMAIRNFYLQAEKNEVGVWAGSRMYRGDDIYLLDFWPLDEVNTVGAGASYRQGRFHAEAHVGLNRLVDPFQFQERDLNRPMGGVDPIAELDRQRTIASAKTSYRIWDPGHGPAVRLKFYGELQAVPEGTRRQEDDSIEQLPSDFGWTAGAQLGAWGYGEGNSHANAFFRYSRGLTAFGELAAPTGLSRDRRSYPGASEILLGLSGAHDATLGDRAIGGLVGAYIRRFEDASPAAQSYDNGWEYIVNVRPRVEIYQSVEAATDLSYQVRYPRGLSPIELAAMDPAVFQVAPMVVYSPFGSGSYARPQFRFVYRAAHLNDGARDLYLPDDPRRFRPWVHFLGVQAEWWFNATYR